MKKVVYFLFFIFLCIFVNSICIGATNESTLIEQGNYFLSKIEKNENPELKSVYIAKAQYYFYTACQSDPPPVDALISLGKVYLLQDRYTDAKNTLFRAYSIDRYNPNAIFEYAELCFKFDDYPSALKLYNSALKHNYKDKTQNLTMIAKCYEKLGDLQNALAIYQKLSSQEAYTKVEEIKKEMAEQENQNKEKEE